MSCVGLLYQDLIRTVWFNRVLQAGPASAQENITPQFQELKEVSAMLAETVKEWHRQWKQKGREEGIKMGEEKGRRECETNVFLNSLNSNSAPCPMNIKPEYSPPRRATKSPHLGRKTQQNHPCKMPLLIASKLPLREPSKMLTIPYTTR